MLVHGHRGARAIYAENTIAGFLYAIESGADALELDVHVTGDGVLVVAHDPRINREICTGPHTGAAIRDLTLAEVRQCDCGSVTNPRFPRQKAVPGARLPTLDEVLDLGARADLQFDIEVKSYPDHPEWSPAPESFARMVIDAVRARRLAARVVIQSFDFRVLLAAKQLAPEIRLAALWEEQLGRFVPVVRSAGADIASPQFNLVTPHEVAVAHAAGIKVVPWTANKPDDWRRLIDAGVNGIITDDPAALIAYLKSAS